MPSDPIELRLKVGTKIVRIRIEDADQAAGSSAAVREHSPDFRSVRAGGVRYTFTPMQAAVIKCLWEADEAGAPDVGVATLLEAANSDGNRLRDLFRSHPAWGTLIVAGASKGTYRLSWGAE